MRTWQWIRSRLSDFAVLDMSPETAACEPLQNPLAHLPPEVSESHIGGIEPPGEYGRWLETTSRQDRRRATTEFARRFKPSDGPMLDS